MLEPAIFLLDKWLKWHDQKALLFFLVCVLRSSPFLYFLLFTLFTTSGFFCFSFTYPTYFWHASANSHFSFRLLCFMQVLPRCELLFSLSRSSELSFSSGPAFLLILVIINGCLLPRRSTLRFFFFVVSQMEGKNSRHKLCHLAAGASGRQSRVVGNERWMCRSTGGRLVV